MGLWTVRCPNIRKAKGRVHLDAPLSCFHHAAFFVKSHPETTFRGAPGGVAHHLIDGLRRSPIGAVGCRSCVGT